VEVADYPQLNLSTAIQILEHAGKADPTKQDIDPVAQLQSIIDALCDLSMHDGLTGLANASCFRASLATEIDRCSRTGHSCALILFDVDHFKLVNDTYGHQTGDLVLKAAAGQLQLSDPHGVIAAGQQQTAAVHGQHFPGAALVSRRGARAEEAQPLAPELASTGNELRDLTTFVAGVSPAIPWHVTAYHEDYRMSGTGNTTAAMLWRAVDIGRQAGLQYVYAGNMPGSVGDLETTKCASCGLALIERYGYLVQQYRLLPDGSCPSCRTPVPGRWSASFEGQGWARTIGRRLRVV
jgi:hypothetical protein